ncbi:hypothetical protein FQR65_LT04212 [Abscondita terminalis]|nr:hypothetical protein FQR65_LT04212 [Abscondita terminalis]
MSVYEEFLEDFNEIVNTACKYIDEMEADFKKEIDWLDSIENDIEQFKKTGVLSTQTMRVISEVEEMENAKENHKLTTKTNGRDKNSNSSSSTNSTKENIQANHQSSSKRVTRNQSKLSAVKHHDNLITNPDSAIKVKLEKISPSVISDVQTNSDVQVKVEMPPPNKRPLRNTRKKKGIDMSFKIKCEVIDEEMEKINSGRDSDVQIQNQAMDVVVLEDTINDHTPVRSTRSRTKIRKVKDQNNVADIKRDNEHEIKEPRRTRSLSKNEKNLLNDNEEPQSKKRKIEEEFEQTELNAVSTSTPISLNQFGVTELTNRPVPLNTTVVLETATVQKEPVFFKNIMTDDEDIVDNSPPETIRQKKTKPVFSPYENSPVKKRVEAFEKLGTTSQIPSKTTRSKLLKQSSFDNDANKTSSAQNLRELRAVVTPLSKKYFQPSSGSKLPTIIPNSTYSLLNRAATAIKTSGSQLEFHEREIRRMQKDAEALKKKEALILAQTEEKRKKRKEREIKVQQTKMAIEKDKQKQLEIVEKAKEIKLKQMLAEKEAKFFKQKEEAAKKRAAVAKKASDIKRNDEKFIPPYFKYETPLLPTPDCYDSDESSSNHRIKVPNFQKERVFSEMQKSMQNAENYKKMFFLSGPRTPNLQAIFPTIEPSKLKRTSSAIWNKTEMSMLNNLTDEELDED